jgi:hypothetical protein
MRRHAFSLGLFGVVVLGSFPAMPSVVLANEDPLARLRAMGANFASLEIAPMNILPFCAEAAAAYDTLLPHRPEVVQLAAGICMRTLRPNRWCPATPDLCGRDRDRERTVAWLSQLSGFAASDLQILAHERDVAAEHALIRNIKAQADNPPSDGPCGALTGYSQLLVTYAKEVDGAKQRDAAVTPLAEAAQHLSEKASLFRRKVYRSTIGIRDRHQDNPSPEQLDEEAKWFECLGDYQDAPQEAAKAKALAADLRAKAGERDRCDMDPVCHAKQVAEDRRREIQDFVDEICSQIAERKATKANIATEHRYAHTAGVVNLSSLEEMKETLQFLDERIADKSARYKEATGKAFSPKLCR